jgi:hypothetical protein
MIPLVREKSSCREKISTVKESVQFSCCLAVVYLLRSAVKIEALNLVYHRRDLEYKLKFKKKHQFFPRQAVSLFAFGGQSAVEIFIAFAADLHIVSAAGSTFLHLHRVSSCNSTCAPQTTTP